MTPVIGIDFDNTIVCYDEIFHKVALEKNLIPHEIPQNKEQVRNYLRKIGQENLWTELQGYVYGMRMREASPYPGVKDFFIKALQRGLNVFIISHKTRYPYLGPQYDLHKAASEWLQSQGFFDSGYIGLDPSCVFFEISINKKIERIKSIRCSHFVDDLSEFLLNENFPQSVSKLLFSPHQKDFDNYKSEKNLFFKTWKDLNNHLLL